jgi:hypothetical protein
MTLGCETKAGSLVNSFVENLSSSFPSIEGHSRNSGALVFSGTNDIDKSRLEVNAGKFGA